MKKIKLNTISFLIKPSSSMCNLVCSYCFYADIIENRSVKNYGFIEDTTVMNLISRAIDITIENGIITFAFQGGEPTLIGLEFYKRFIKTVNELKGLRTIQYAIQTNGTTLNKEWAKFFKENNFLVGVSLDGFESNHDSFRYDIHKKGQFLNVLKGIQYLKDEAVEFNILTVLTHQLSQYPQQLYQFYKQQKFEYIQLIPCLPGFEEIDDETALKPKDFYRFYKEFFNLWMKDSERFQIGLLNDIIGLFYGYRPVTCGMLGNCSIQFVIEGDGSIYPCDFYVLDQNKLGNINVDALEDIIKSSLSEKFLNEPKRISKQCDICKFKQICHGNCKRMNVVYFDDVICGYQQLLQHIYENLKFNSI